MLTHNYETTTILYYTAFLPGVLLHEIVYWLMAGVMNVRADRSIQWPEKQEIGNLQLNFIKLAPKANPIKRAVISAMPLIVGLLAIWVIAVNIFQLETVMLIAGSGRLEDFANAIGVLTSTPDFWLWFYISFTIANTMFPTIPKDMRGWWQIGGAIAVIVITLLILGIGQSFMSDISLTIAQVLNSLALTLVLTITINVVMVMLLGAVESLTERITGHSATFQKGKMITMTREEALKLKQEAQEKRLAARSTPTRRRATPDATTIYAFEFPIPGPPGQEPVTKGVAAVLGMDVAGDLPDSTEGDEVIETTATDSTRQRMLKLFPDQDEATQEDTKSIAENTPSLTAGTSRTVNSQSKVEKEQNQRPKPVFDIRPIGKQDDIETVDDDDDTTDKPFSPTPASETSNTPSWRSKINLPDDTQADEDTEDKPLSPIPTPKPDKRPALQSKINLPDDTQTDDTEDKPLSPVPAPKTDKLPTRQSKINLPDDTQTDDDTEDKPLSPVPTTETSDTPSWRSKINLPDDKPTLSDEDDEEVTEDSDNTKERTSVASSPFSRPFAPRETIEDDGDDEDEDETLNTTETQFERPFRKPPEDKDKSTSRTTASSWRDQLSNLPTTDDEDDDEQLASPRPRSSSMFDTLNKPDEDKSTARPTASSWRNQLSDLSTADDEDDDDDEQLTSPRPRSSSMFDKLNKPDDKPTAQPTASSWRDQLSNLPTTDEDDEDDDEQLTSPRTRSSSMFDALNKPDDKPSAPPAASSWRDQLSNLPTTDEDDEDDDEELPRSSSLLSGLGRRQAQQPRSTILGSGSRPAPKPTSKSDTDKSDKPASDWRSQIFADDEDDDEELSYEPIEDDFIYEDEDEFDHFDGDEDYFDDDFS